MRNFQSFLLAVILVFGSAAVSFAQNYKIKQVTTINGQKIESTVYVKGMRKRTEGGGFMGIGGDVATVEQCDLKRNLKISDKKKMYAVEPFADDTETPPPTTTKPTTPSKPAPKVKGGVVTYVSNITDTGERKQMFGLQARRIKTSMSMEASPDACMKGNMSVQTDGWYVDLPQFSCPVTARPQIPQTPTGDRGGGCRDQIKFRTSGGGKLGFPLSETTTINSGGTSFTQTTETLEFSKAALDAALFDIPAGYALTDNEQNLYGKPDLSAIIRGQTGDDVEKPKTTDNSAVKPKKAGTIRIGVYMPTNKNGGENVSETNLQTFLIQKLTVGNVEAVGVNTETDARAANCDYVLSSDFSKLKQSASSKIGGIFGKVTNTDTSAARNYEAQVDFVLVSLKDGKTVLKNKASDKTKNDVDRAAEAVLSQEATTVLGAVRP